jgi:hypothetical protein
MNNTKKLAKTPVNKEIRFTPIEHYPRCHCGKVFANISSLAVHLFFGCDEEMPRKFGALAPPILPKPPRAAPAILDLLEGETFARRDSYPGPDDDEDRLELEGGCIEYPPQVSGDLV